MAKCYDCGLNYEDPGWIEAVIPDKVWNEISPTGDQGGILCITCISRRLIKKVMEIFQFFYVDQSHYGQSYVVIEKIQLNYL